MLSTTKGLPRLRFVFMWYFRRPTADLARSAIGATKVVDGRGRCFELEVIPVLVLVSKLGVRRSRKDSSFQEPRRITTEGTN